MKIRARPQARPGRSRFGGRIAAVALVLSVAPAAAQEEGPAYGGQPVAADGWYTEEQAERGAEAYARHCARCHHVDLGGAIGVTPPLAGPEFLARWEGASVDRLFHFVRTLMPLDDPSSLHDQIYLDILAHVLRTNGLPPGEAELRPSADQLSRMVLPEAEDDEDEVPELDEEDPPAAD